MSKVKRIRLRSTFIMMWAILLLLSADSSAQIFPAWQVGKLFEVYGTRGQNLGASCAGNFDLNRDGKPDFAVGTLQDTTLIYFGGKDVLDTLWDVRLIGGENAIVHGDFDGDHQLDFIISGFTLRGSYYDSGKVLFYKGISTPPYVDTIPVEELHGDAYQKLGKRLRSADFNGDHIRDLIIYSSKGPRLMEMARGNLGIYLGGKNILSSSAIKLEYRETDTLIAHFAEKFDVGDINGDSLSDLIVWSNQKSSFQPRDSVDFYLEIYYGKKDFAQKDTIADVVFHRRDYPFLKDIFSLVDLNGDHIDDLCFLVQDTLLFQLGKNEKLTQLGPFERIANPDTRFVSFVVNAEMYRIGDFNGDGFEDIMVLMYYNTIPGWFFTIYLGGPRWYTRPAYFYMRGGNDLINLAYDLCGVGNIDGEGGEEFLITKPMGEMRNDFFSYHDGYFVVIKSDTTFQLGVNDLPTINSSAELHAFPNPSSSLTTIELQIEDSNLHSVDLFLMDVLGRKVGIFFQGELESGSYRYSMNTSALPAGMYIVHCILSGKSILKKLILSR